MAVSVEIQFGASVHAFSGATVHVRILDVTHADAPASTVAEAVRHDIDYDPATDPPLSFTLQPESAEARALYAVAVHVDVDGDGMVSVGDLITTQSYPVLTFGHPERVAVVVERVA